MKFNPPIGAHLQYEQPLTVSPEDTLFEQPEELLAVNTAKGWMQQASERPVPKMLFGKFWFEGELCILFADSNLGKSILAVQIGNSINTGEAMQPFAVESRPQPILYCDFELTDKQFESRYSDNYQNHHPFRDDFYRAELNTCTELPKGFNNFDEYLIAALERAIVQTGVKVVIVDNLTYLRNETEQAKKCPEPDEAFKGFKEPIWPEHVGPGTYAQTRFESADNRQ